MKKNDEEAISIGKSIIKRFFEYYEAEGLDDETEFFPILKIIILSIADGFKNSSQNEEIEKELKNYSRKLYSYLWLLHAREDEEEIDEEYEQREAISNFEKIYREVKV